MKQVITLGRRVAIGVLLLSFLGCSEDDLDRLPQVISNFTYTVNEDTGTVTFINVSEGARTYVWDFGDGTTSKEIDPIKTYTSSGTYTVTLVATNQAGASNTFEDQLTLTVKKGIALPITFDQADVLYNASVFAGATFRIVPNPDQSGSNDKASNVGEITNSGAAFEGLFFDLATPVDLTTEKQITANFWSDTPVEVLMKLEEGSGAPTEATASHGGTGWEAIAFDFSSSGSYSRLTLFVDGPGTTAGTFYIDDIAQAGEDPGGGDNPLEACEGGELVNDFESADDSIFSNFGGGVGTIIDNPDTSVNPSAKVGQYVKNAGEVFAGITIEVDPDIDFNAGVFSIDVNSQAVRQLLFKLEGLGIERVIPTSGTGWETITYDFSSVAGNIGAVTAITLIMDNGTAGDGSGDWTIQFDNIRLCSNEDSGGGGTCPPPPTGELLSNGGFEANSGDGSCWQLNAGGGSVTIINTDANTGTYSARLTTGPAQVPNLKQERFAPGVAGNQNIQVTFRYKVTTPFVDGAILQVLTFSEFTTDPAVANDLGNADISTVNVWQTYTGTFTTAAGIEEGISLLIQATCGGAPTCAGEVLIDDVVVTQL
jgi:PKD repeat protein